MTWQPQSTPSRHSEARRQQAEAALLGLLLNGFTGELPNLHPLEFIDPPHRLVWKAIVALRYLEVGLCVPSVARHLAARGELERAGGEDYLWAMARAGKNAEGGARKAE